MTDPSFQTNVVTEWNEVALAAIRTTASKPTIVARALQTTHNAMYDAWAAYDQKAVGVHSELDRPASENTEANKAEAVSFAAFRALSELFSDDPDLIALFRATMHDQGYDPDNTGTDPHDPAGVGNHAAHAVLAFRETDGSNAANDFADTTGYQPVNHPGDNGPGTPGDPSFDPNHWQPLRVPTGELKDANGIPIADDDDPWTYIDQLALTPHWGQVIPFALESGDQFRPPAPPQLGDHSPYVDGLGQVTTGDQAYRDQFTEVLHASAILTDEQKAIAEFWADGPRTESPPGHWNQLAQGISVRDEHGIDEDIVLFFMLNNAIYDASIATWEAKYAYDFVRPQSAIRHLYFDEEVEAWGGPNADTQTIPGQEWQPYQNVTFVTPPFPEWVSGHSTFSAAAAEILRSYTGSDTFYDGETAANLDLDRDGELDLLGQVTLRELAFEDYDGPPIVLQWETFTEAAEEAGVSRIYGGIHLQDGNLFALDLGDKIGELAYEKSLEYIHGAIDAPQAAVVFESEDAAFDNSFGVFTIDASGQFTDVELLFSRVDNTVLDPGDRRDLEPLGEDEAYGFFLLADGHGRNAVIRNEGDGLEGELRLVERDSLDPASLASDGPLNLELVRPDGTIIALDGPVFVTADADPADAVNPLNQGGGVQVMTAIDAAGHQTLAFEDVRTAVGDNDFNDAVFKLEWPSPPEAHEAEMALV